VRQIWRLPRPCQALAQAPADGGNLELELNGDGGFPPTILRQPDIDPDWAVKNSPQQPPAAAPENGKQRPAHEVRLGRIKATIWGNQNDNGTWYNVTLSRSYKDGEEWKSSSSFGRDELLTIAKAADMANTWIHNQSQGPPTNGNDGSEGEEEIPY